MTEPTTPPAAPTPDPTGEPPRKPDDEGAETTAVSEAAAAAPGAADAIGTPETVPADGVPAEAASGAPAATATTPATPTTATTATSEPVPAEAAGPGRRVAVLRAMRTLMTVVLGVLLFAGGVALGNYLFQTTRPAPVRGVAVTPTTDGLPPVAQEFITALAANDADSLRSSLDQEPHLDLTREMTKFGIQRVDNVEILGTHIDGGRSATEILMQYESTDGTPFAINLVILVDGGKIEGFR